MAVAKRLVPLVVVVLVAACTKTAGPRPAAAAPFRAAIVAPTSLDPAQARSLDELLVADQLYDSLTAYDPKTLEPVPALASAWTSTPDQLHWDFTLRPAARFADGRPVTSADVKASFERIARKGSGSSAADLLEPVTGYAPVAVEGSVSELAGVTTPSPEVVRIDLDQPWSLLPVALANPAFGILPKDAADAPALPENVAGSGPFRLTGREEGRLTLTPATGVETRSPSLEFLLFPDKDQAYAAFEAGGADWSSVPADRAGDAANRHGRELFKPYVAELFYAFNLRSPKFSDPRFREAISRAVDRRAIIDTIYNGTVLPIEGLVVRGLPGYQERPCEDRCGYDRERAAALAAELAAAGPLPEVQIDFEEDRTQTAVATAIRDNLAAVGIPAALRPKPLADYQQFAVTGEQELFRLGWIAPYASADAILTPLFRSGFPNNLIGLSSPAVDEPLLLARAEADPARRVEYLQQAERAVLAELVVIPIAQFEIQTVASPRVQGLELTSTGTFDGRTVWVAPRG
ncbi:MAG: ABC transporter substrate-binding protein [Actinomycetota bacterium]|nr:ABC transporter substrate-binding protein [Actinomycetota bacterium]